MVEVYVELVVAVVLLFVNIYFIMKPVRLVNFVVGFLSVFMGVAFVQGGSFGGVWYFGLMFTMISLVCLLRASRRL